MKPVCRLLTLTLVLLLAGQSASAQQNTLQRGVAAGDTTQTSTVLWARSAALGFIFFEVADNPDFIGATQIQGLVITRHDPVKVQLSDLTPGTQFYYRVTDSAGTEVQGRFRTSSPLGEYGGLRFGVVGDWQGALRPFPAISNIPARELDFLVSLGDNIYADLPSPALTEDAETLPEFRIKYVENLGTEFGINHWAEVRASTSLLATIDDHEVEDRLAGGAFFPYGGVETGDPNQRTNDNPIYENGLRVFQEYNPLRDEFYGDTGDARTANEHRLYRYNTYGSDAAIFVLDTRSFRDAPLRDDTQSERVRFDPARTLLGRAQLEDLKRDLLDAHESGITWKCILSPTPIQSLGSLLAQDLWVGYAAERAELFQFIRNNDITNVVFITARLHGYLVNDLFDQTEPEGVLMPLNSFEVVTNAVAVEETLGVFALDSLSNNPALNLLPRAAQETTVELLINTALGVLTGDLIGLELPNVQLLSGDYLSGFTHGWTEFEINAATQALTVTAYGIDAYTYEDLQADPASVLSRTPAIISQFVVQPSQ